MVKEKRKETLRSLLWSGCIAGEDTVVIDAITTLFWRSISLPVFLAVWLAAVIGLQACRALTVKRKRTLAAALLAVMAGVVLLGYGCWQSFSKNAVYADADDGKAAMFADKTAMIIVPHEDDDINVAGGVMDEYLKYGSEVYVVFVTNGDFEGLGEIRINEAIEYCGHVGIAEDHVVFLGYGDQWAADGPHLYNAGSGTVRQSLGGYTSTYGTASHPAYRTGNAYTADNLMADMEGVILEYKPDVLICSDYDSHIDHKATTLLFEKVMGKILKEHADYTPTVYKGFAYNSAWLAEADFYEMNILSTQDIYAEPYLQEPEIYRWKDRVRLPVSAQTLSRSLMTTDAYEGMSIYGSQGEKGRSSRMANGDKVFWERQTESVCYRAEICVSSGSGAVLNDFMLLENKDLVDTERLPYDGVWIPEEGDEQPSVTVTFPEKTDVSAIVLYDHPAEERNVLNAVVRFDDGTTTQTGPLDKTGAATSLQVEKTGVEWFSVTLTDTEGNGAGLTEIEAFRRRPEKGGKLIKIMDAGENFVYDYCIDRTGTQEFFLYTYGEVAEINGENYSVSCSNENCHAALSDGRLIVNCPAGEACTVQISDRTGTLSDSVYIRNPGTLQRGWIKLMQTMEERVYYRMKYMVTCRIFRKVSGILGRIL